MKIKKEDLGYIALLACILNTEYIDKECVIPRNRTRKNINIDKELKEFIGELQFV